MSKTLKSNFSFGLSHGSVRTYGSDWAEPFDQSKAATETKLNLNFCRANLRSGLKPKFSAQISVWSQSLVSATDSIKKRSHPVCIVTVKPHKI